MIRIEKFLNRLILLALFLFMFLPAAAAAANFTELMADPEFAEARPEERLQLINHRLEDGLYQLMDIQDDLTARLILDVINDSDKVDDRLNRYSLIRIQNKNLPPTYDLEIALVMEFLTTDPKAIKTNILGRMKMIQKLQIENKIGWPVVSPLHIGMLAAHLAQSRAYRKMDGLKKLKYLSKLVSDKVTSQMVVAKFAKGAAWEMVSGAEEKDREALIKRIESSTDYFTNSAIRSGYLD